jgi:hypothetical protein
MVLMTEPRRTITDAERRARLGIRHALSRRVADPLAAAATVVCLHATQPTSVYLSAWARSGASRSEVDRCLYVDRSIVKQLAMRRTVFAFPRDLLPAVRGSAAARVARQQAALLARSVVAGGLATDGAGWVERVCAETLALLQKAPATTRQLRAQLPELGQRLPPPERAGAAPTPVAPRVLTVLAASGSVVRGGARSAALLPALDPTTMGWRGRSFYVDELTAGMVYDSAGNGKPTAWWEGRIVGQWAQAQDGSVVVMPTAALSDSAMAALGHQAAQLTAWFDGEVIRSSLQSPRYSSESSRQQRDQTASAGSI